MSGFWVLKHLFKAQAVNIDWGQEAEILGYDGPRQPSTVDFGPLQFRWLLHPSLGLPRQPFVLAHRRPPGGSHTIQDLANLPGWEVIETVGLPVDDGWAETGYELGPQGPPDAPLAPFDAAMRRLELGAPRIGWAGLQLPTAFGPTPLPDWEPVVFDAFLRDLVEGQLLRGIRTMLEALPDPAGHSAYSDPAADAASAGRMDLRPFVVGRAGSSGHGEPASAAWHPLGLLLLSAGVDPLASLALGFGTAVNPRVEDDELFRVSVRHLITVGGRELDVELADVVTVNHDRPAPERPRAVSAALIGHTRPQTIDGPAVDTVGVTWQRPLNPVFAHHGDDAPQAVSYAIGRSDRHGAAILLTRRPADVQGYQPFVASKPAGAEPVLFADHRPRATTFDSEHLGDPIAEDHTYAVAAQDAFGRWSNWATVPYSDADEPPHAPSILGATLQPDGALTVDFGWDWSDRSPEFMELLVSWEDEPATILLDTRMQFGGAAAPPGGGPGVVPLTPDLQPADAWGSDQDHDPGEPATRFYRLETTLSLDFAGRPRRVVQIQGRGQCHLHERVFPTFNVSPLGRPYAREVYDPFRPGPPPVPETPQWATVRDASGVSRALLTWTAVPRATGYVVYEASETTLLAAFDLPGPDTNEAFTSRLAVLRAAALPSRRAEFRRVQAGVISTTSFEVTLPRGSSVMHLYAVTALSANNQESEWPASSAGFIAVAAARIRVPRTPVLEATVDTTGAEPIVHLRVEIDEAPPVDAVEIYRVPRGARPDDVDSMGRPQRENVDPGTDVVVIDQPVLPSWQRIWYRAVAWSAPDDARGYVEARSAPSAAVFVLVPPSLPPSIMDIRVNEPGSSESTVLVSWQTSAPFTPTAFGSHRAVVEVPFSGRLEAQLDTLTRIPDLAALPGPGQAVGIQRVLTQSGDRLYVWLSRPSLGMAFAIDLKVIDPLGRVGRETVDVPPLEATLPIIDTIDPDNGSPGGRFTIFGSNLVLQPGDAVIVLLDIGAAPDAPPNPGPLQVVGSTLPTQIEVVIPAMPQEGQFNVVVSRSDGAEATSAETLFITLL
jgi:hypothetical protein